MDKTTVRQAIEDWCSSNGHDDVHLHIDNSNVWKIDPAWVLHIKTQGQGKLSQRVSYKRQGVVVSIDFVDIDMSNHVLIETDNGKAVVMGSLMDEMETAPFTTNKIPDEFDCMDLTSKSDFLQYFFDLSTYN